jgi:Ras homolog gene family, member A
MILCYSIAEPATLESLKSHWKHTVETHFNYHESIPVIVLGLKRDIRTQEDYDGRVLEGRGIVYPQVAVRTAQEMRCDRYCECSALTGDVSLI